MHVNKIAKTLINKGFSAIFCVKNLFKITPGFRTLFSLLKGFQNPYKQRSFSDFVILKICLKLPLLYTNV